MSFYNKTYLFGSIMSSDFPASNPAQAPTLVFDSLFVPIPHGSSAQSSQSAPAPVPASIPASPTAPFPAPVNVPHPVENVFNLRIPPFLAVDPQLWMWQLESLFVASGIHSEVTKFHVLSSSLPYNVALAVRDVIALRDPPRYYDLKAAILARMIPSRDRRMRNVLDKQKMANGECPSVFFRHFHSSAQDLIPYDVILTRFNDAMPSSIQSAIASQLQQLKSIFRSSGVRVDSIETIMLEIADAMPLQSSSTTAAAHHPKKFEKKQNSKQNNNNRGNNNNKISKNDKKLLIMNK